MMMNPAETMLRVDTLLSHIWMVRTFLKHSEEAEEDDELAEVHRELYDYMLALGPTYDAKDHDGYLKQAHKKLAKLKKAEQLFCEIQPEISSHMNFRMAVRSLSAAVKEVESLIVAWKDVGKSQS